jgi:phosphopantothenoylcysteine decarboxylase/phosphopantothenate--cysteine ligase
MSDTLKLVRNPDILKTLSLRAAREPRTTLFIGFAAETNDVISEARRKCREKGLEMIVANDVTKKGSGFGTDTNCVTFLRKDGSVERLPLMSKAAVATRIVREAERMARECGIISATSL